MPYDEDDFKVQLMLAYLGYEPGTLDGVMGRNTRAAIKHFQGNSDLYQTGEADEDTVDALYNQFIEGNYTASGLVLQYLLHFAGYDPGTIDGIIGRNTIKALKSFQSDYELDENGQQDADTIAALKEALYGEA
jgi:peptidoglycan hydrolase-like protein with peptidoglycan-binding domain